MTPWTTQASSARITNTLKAFYSYFIVEETEAQRDTATCLKSHSKLTAGMEIETLFFPMPQADW